MQLALKRKNTSSPGMAASGRYSFVVVFLISLILFVQNVKSEDVVPADKPLTSIERLRLQLFTNYDKNAQPLHKLQISKVGIRLTVSYIDIDELNGKVTVHAWLALSWKDDHRSWNSSEYENITSMHIKSREVWHPDITLFNSAGDGNYVGDTMVILYSDGSFLFVPPVTYTAYCTLNLQMWPYDTQTCNLKLGTLNWDFIDVDALTNKTTLETEDVYKTTEWQIVDSHYNYTSEHYYNYIDFVFKLQRNSHMYGAVIFTPATCIILLALCTFWLPPQMGEKILLNGVTIIIIVAFLMYFAQLLPIMAENTPLIVLFYSSSLLLVSISTIIAVIVLYLSMAKHKRRIPDFLKQLLNGRVGKGLLLAHFTLEAEQNESNMTRSKELGEQVFGESDTNDLIDTLGGHNQSAPSERAIQFDWVLLATAVDRLFFLAYCFLFFILGIVYII